MEREILARCGLFSSMTHSEISTLLGCLGARYRRMLPGVSMITDRAVVVLSGEVISGGQSYGTGAALLCGGRSRGLSALLYSEALFINYTRLLDICKNSCPQHRKILANLLRLETARADAD
jgi:hypothetical protein